MPSYTKYARGATEWKSIKSIIKEVVIHRHVVFKRVENVDRGSCQWTCNTFARDEKSPRVPENWQPFLIFTGRSPVCQDCKSVFCGDMLIFN